MTSVFISYSRRDKAIADVIAAELRNRGAEVFIDYQELIAGESFIGRLGREIEKRDVVVFLVSPHSVESKWVQAEIAWGFTKSKTVIPVLIEPATMVDFFFLISVEQVDFTRWSIDGDISAAIRKLAAALDLSADPIKAELVPEISAISSSVMEVPHETKPAFATGDLSEMFMTAAELAGNDPEQAIFLYQQIVQTDANYMRGQAKAYIERDKERLRPIRLKRMLAKATTAMQRGKWEQASQLARDMLTVDTENDEAKQILARSQKLLECEPIYQSAILATKAERWNAAVRFLKDVRETCPDYGDPARLYKLEKIRQALLTEITSSNAEFMIQLARLQAHTSAINSVAFAPDGGILASASDDGTLRLWDISTYREVAKVHGHTDAVYCATFIPKSRIIATASADKTVAFWDLRTNNLVSRVTGHSGSVRSVATNTHGTLFASASTDRTIVLWDETYQKIAILAGHNSYVACVGFAPKALLLASASADRTVRLWSLRSRAEVASFKHDSYVRSVAFSPNGELVASASSDGLVRLWDVKARMALISFIGRSHTDSALGVAFSPDGKLLASISADRTVRIWDLDTHSLVSVLKGHTNSVNSVAFSPDGKLLATGSEDKSVILWGLP